MPEAETGGLAHVSDGEKFTLTTEEQRVPPGSTMVIWTRPQERAGTFHWQWFEIANPERWNICDIKVGNHSLFPSADVIPATWLNRAVIAKRGCRIAEDFSIEVAYVGDDPTGETFTCTVFGEEVSW